MFKRNPRIFYRVAAAGAVVAGMAVSAPSAMALANTDTVTGTAQPTLSVGVSTPASAFVTGFQPGGQATSTGALLVTDTSATPKLSVADTTSASNKGQMQLLIPCSGSESALTNPLQVKVTGTSVTSTQVGLSGTAQITAQTASPVAAGVWTSNYTQNINSDEALLTGCVYTVTATYTLQ